MKRSATRRRLLGSVGAGLAAGLAGCVGDDDVYGSGGGSTGGGHDHDHGGGDGSDGGSDVSGSDVAYAFAPGSVSFVDPEGPTVVDGVSAGIHEASWGEAVVSADGTELYASERRSGNLVVIDLDAREVVDEISVGAGANHLYRRETEVWVHAADEGSFSVVDVAAREVVDTVSVGDEGKGEGGGRLLAHEALGSTALATSASDPAVHVLDLDGRERTDSIDFGAEGGAGEIVYSAAVELAYVERTGGVETTAVVDPDGGGLVEELDVTGRLYLTPDEQRLCVLGDDELVVFDLSEESTEERGRVHVAGGPSDLAFNEGNEGLYGFVATARMADLSVLDLDAVAGRERIDFGAEEDAADATAIGATVTTTDEHLVVTAPDGTLGVVELPYVDLLGSVYVERGVQTIAYVPDSTEE